MKIPPYHQIEWAGFVTSWCRSQVFMAAIDDLDSVVAYETDALFTTRPLPGLALSSKLGEWDRTVFTDMSYFQSGFYFATTDDGKSVARSRGVEVRSISREACLQAFPAWETVTGQTTRFITMGTALQGRWKEWRQWQTRPRVLTLEPTGKREHYPCPACAATGERSLGGLHSTTVPMGLSMRQSCEFPVAWINPDPAMVALEELREEGRLQWEE